MFWLPALDENEEHYPGSMPRVCVEAMERPSTTLSMCLVPYLSVGEVLGAEMSHRYK